MQVYNTVDVNVSKMFCQSMPHVTGSYDVDA